MRHWEDLERPLTTLYLKEIDQEESVWRSLPFFSATLAVEVLLLNQVLPLAAVTSGPWREGGSVSDRLRATLIGQLAAATDANRAINQSRAAERTRAGILLLASIVTTSIVVAVTVSHGMVTEVSREPEHGSAEGERSPPAAAGLPRSGRDGSDSQAGPGRAAEDAGGKQGLELPGKSSIPEGGRGAEE